MTIPTLIGEIKRFPTGSRFICNPPVMDTDEDWVILVENKDVAVDRLTSMVGEAWTIGGSGSGRRGGSSVFTSLKRHTVFPSSGGVVNAIITADFGFYSRFKAATAIAKRLNILRKEDRIALFNAVLDGWVDEDQMREPLAPVTIPNPNPVYADIESVREPEPFTPVLSDTSRSRTEWVAWMREVDTLQNRQRTSVTHADGTMSTRSIDSLLRDMGRFARG